MYTTSKKLMILGIASLLATTLYAGEVTIPNTFTANTKAKAAEVNANFTAVKTSINNNAKNINTLQDSIAGIKTVELVESAELTDVFLDQTSITINAPKNGYVQILATGTIQVLGKTTTRAVRVYVGITGESNGTPIVTYQTEFYRDATNGSGDYIIPYSTQGIFAVTPGVHTYYLVANGFGSTSEKLFWNRITATFYANDIGN